MATIFRLRKNTDDTGSGGKIMRGRRAPEPRSPYSRLPPPPPPPTPATPSENPSRLLGLISPAGRILTGAAKMVSSVFFPDSPPDSSSSEDDNDDDDMSAQGDDIINQNEETSVANMDVETTQKNERILAIEQLLMQESLSRDESNKLVKIIESRVVDFPARIQGDVSRRVLTDRVLRTGDTLPGASQPDWQSRKSPRTYSYLGNSFDSPCTRTPSVGGHEPDICSSAVLEAKKWVEDKKTELYSQKDKSPGTFISSSCMLSNITEGEQGSPVLMAKSYMKSRPPWASPTASHIVSQSSPIGRYLLKEETPHSIGGHALSASKEGQRNNLAIESVTILDGSRRGRTEDSMQPLTAHSNTREDEKAFVEADKKEEELGSRIHSSDSLPVPGSVKQSKHFPEDLAKNNGCSAYDAPEHEASSTSPHILTNDHKQDLEGTQIIVEGGNTEQDDSRPQEDQVKQKERDGFTEGFVNNENFSASSLSAKVNKVELSTGVSKKEGRNVASSSGGNWEGSCEILSETFLEVPDNNEVDPTSGSIGISSRQSMEPNLMESPSISNPSMKRRQSPRVKKPVKYSRRGRGRGK